MDTIHWIGQIEQATSLCSSPNISPSHLSPAAKTCSDLIFLSEVGLSEAPAFLLSPIFSPFLLPLS